MKTILVFVSILLSFVTTHAFVCQDTPEGMYVYQDAILELAKKNVNMKDFKKGIAEPMHCLFENYKTQSGPTRYVAGACLRRLLGGPEIQGFTRGKEYDVVLKGLIVKNVNQKNLLKESEMSAYASSVWEEYKPFCKTTMAERDCVELLPDQKQISEQSELLGASSMMLLRSAYKQFSGATKKRVQELIVKLYRETPQEQILKRKVIDEIYFEMNQPRLILKES